MKAYERWAGKYDKDYLRNPAIVAESNLISLLAPLKSDMILEIGCGTGRLTIPISKKCMKVIGIDFSENMLKVAREKSDRYKNIEYLKADARKRLPFGNSSFDKVIVPLAINHIQDLGSFFREIHRLLSVRGILVFDDINPDGSVHPVFRDTIFQLSQRGKKIFYHHSMDSIVNTLHKVGFEIEQIKFSRVDERIKSTITRESFLRNKGRTFGIVVRARKDVR